MATKKKTDTEEQFHILPAIIMDSYVVTPLIPQPIKIDNEESKKVLSRCNDSKSPIFFGISQNPSQEKEGKIRKYGVVCLLDRVLEMPGAPSLAFVRPIYRAFLDSPIESPDIQMVKIKQLSQINSPARIGKEAQLYIQRIEELLHNLLHFAPEPERETAEKLISENSGTALSHLYAIAHVAPMTTEEKFRILIPDTFKELLETLATVLDESEQRFHIQSLIQEKTHHELSQQQKEAFLRTHLKQIKEELGENEEYNDIDLLLKKSSSKKWDKATQEHFDREIQKIKRLNINNPEYSVQYAYLETFLQLPWNKFKDKKVNLKKVEDVLDRDHYGLEKIKERILEYMAVTKLRKDLKAPIICLYGPPGVGKTSIGKSVAEAVGREYKRISLGGMHDEAEIRGHRRTYIGAMPGRFLHTLTKCEYGDPLILLDEIDKVGKDYKGDPSSALLEALDPEQNNTFHDNFIDYPYDLSRVLFIATANDLSTIPLPLRDRMEIIEMTGYIPAEKREIALRHLVKKALKNNGFNPSEITFTPEAIDTVIKYYTREAGVRQLEKKISKIIRKIALKKVKKESYPIEITENHVYELLGKKEFLPEMYENNDFPGVATGLAWTPSGGDILFIETSLAPGKGEKITLTGSLGDVMKESAVIALQYLKANALKFGIDQDLFSKYDVHIHVPEGAVPKDGPSAGITIASSMASAFLNKKLKDRLAMTGELTLRGKVLPVGGIKEKIIAARMAGIKTIILSEENRRDIEEIPAQYIEGLEFKFVKTFTDVFKEAMS